MTKIEQIVHKDSVLEASRAAASIDRSSHQSVRPAPGGSTLTAREKLYFSKLILLVFIVFLDIFSIHSLDLLVVHQSVPAWAFLGSSWERVKNLSDRIFGNLKFPWMDSYQSQNTSPIAAETGSSFLGDKKVKKCQKIVISSEVVRRRVKEECVGRG